MALWWMKPDPQGKKGSGTLSGVRLWMIGFRNTISQTGFIADLCQNFQAG